MRIAMGIAKRKIIDEQTNKEVVIKDNKKLRKLLLMRTLGSVILLVSTGVFLQTLPILFIFAGAYLGIPATIDYANTDTLVWLLTSTGILVLSLYGYIVYIKGIWNFFMKKK